MRYLMQGNLWDKLPKFMLGHQTVRTTIRDSSSVYEGIPWTEKAIEDANLITSKTERYPYGVEYHRPVLDLDFEAALIPSSTPGHYHLYLDKQIPKQAYFNLLRALADAGIIERGFADCAIDRGGTSVRLPWIKKEDFWANQADPHAAIKELEDEYEQDLRDLERKRAKLEAAKAVFDRAYPV